MRRRNVTHGVSAAVTALLLATTAVEAQECRLDGAGKWWDRGITATPPSNRAERAAMDANFSTAEALVRKTSYATPRGFAVQPVWHYGDPASPGRLRSYQYLTLTFKQCSVHDEHGSDLTLTFNPNPQLWSESDRPMPDENGDGLYTERIRSEPLFGSTATYGRIEVENTEGLFVLFTAGGESPTVPVTREAYLRARIFNHEGRDQANLKEALAHASKTQYQRWVESAAERKQSTEQIVAGVASVNPSQAAKTRADLEKADREAGETLKKSDPQERADLDRVKSQLTAAGDALRAQLAAMTPAERASPAWVHSLTLVPAGTPNANAVVRINPAFYRARSSPAEPRAILARMQNSYDELRAQHLQLYQQFDWEALKRLLRN